MFVYYFVWHVSDDENCGEITLAEGSHVAYLAHPSECCLMVPPASWDVE